MRNKRYFQHVYIQFTKTPFVWLQKYNLIHHSSLYSWQKSWSTSLVIASAQKPTLFTYFRSWAFSFIQCWIFSNRQKRESFRLALRFQGKWSIVLDLGFAFWSFLFAYAFVGLLQFVRKFKNRRMFRSLFGPNGPALHCF